MCDPTAEAFFCLQSKAPGWFVEHDWQAWDRQLEEDVAAGKLDKLAVEAYADLTRNTTG